MVERPLCEGVHGCQGRGRREGAPLLKKELEGRHSALWQEQGLLTVVERRGGVRSCAMGKGRWRRNWGTEGEVVQRHWAWGVVGVRGERVGEGRRCQRERRVEARRYAGDGGHTPRDGPDLQYSTGAARKRTVLLQERGGVLCGGTWGVF